MRPRNIFLRNLLAPLEQPFVSLTPLILLVAVCLSAVAEGQIQPGQQPQRRLPQEQASREPSILSSRNSTTQPESGQQVGLPNASWQGRSEPLQPAQGAPAQGTFDSQPFPQSQHGDVTNNHRAQPLLTQPPSGTLRDSQFQRLSQQGNTQQTVTPASSSGAPRSVPSAVTQQSSDLAVITASASVPVSSQQAYTPAASSSPTRTPLHPPTPGNQQTKQRTGSTSQMLVSVGSSLVIVIGLFFGFIWFYRKSMGARGGGGLPKNVVQILGRTPVAPRQHLVLLRFGSKLVLVSMVQGEARTISEITDPLEVDQIAGMCESQQSTSVTHSFREILAQGVKA